MQNLNHVPATRQSLTPPEVRDAIRTLRAADFRLESENHLFDWESRLEMADELRAVLDDLPSDELADITAGVVRDLDDELEDFSEWPTRCEAAGRLRRVARALEAREVAANA